MIDVVYPLVPSRQGDLEIRYSLRSFARYFADLGQVWIVGHKPAWVTGVKYLRAGDPHPNKDANLIAKLHQVCLHAESSERLVFASDDQFLLRPVSWPMLGPYRLYDLARRNPGSNRWCKRLLRTKDWLAGRELSTWHCDTHTPAPIERVAFLDVVALCPEYVQGEGYAVNTLYQNAAATPTRPLGQRRAQVFEPLDDGPLWEAAAGRWFLAINDRAVNDAMRRALAAWFPEPCRFEADRPVSVSVRTPPTLSVVVPTLGRDTLPRALASIKAQALIDGDEVLLVQDGPDDALARPAFQQSGLPGRYVALDRRHDDFGASPRNAGIAQAQGEYLAFLDDDDTYRPAAFNAIRDAACKTPGRPLMFRNWVTKWGRTRWADRIVKPSNVGTPMFVVPNDPERLAVWPGHRGGDYGFIHETLRLWPAGSLVWCPEILSDYLAPGTPGPRPMRRNLLYHVYPLRANDQWRSNVRRLLRYWDVFNGRKLVGVVLDGRTHPVEAVREEFGDERIQWLVARNLPHLGERVTFVEGLRRLRSLNPDEATFYAHTKGTNNTCGRRRMHDDASRARVARSVEQWRNRMYHGCLGLRHNLLDRTLRKFAAAGCFRVAGDVGRVHKNPDDVPCHWYFAGTFFWFNHLAYFGHPFPVEPRRNRWAAEYHLGCMFHVREAHCFLDVPRRIVGKLYGLTDQQWHTISPDPPDEDDHQGGL